MTRGRGWRGACGALLVSLVACTSGAGGPHARLVTAHNVLSALGLGQVGHISEGSLAEGQSARFPVELEAQCYTFAAFGGDGVRDVDVSLMDANSVRVAGDTAHDGQATLQHCVQTRGRYTVVVRMAQGAGAYLVSTWQGSVRGSGGGGRPAGDETGTCASAIPIRVGQTVTGDTGRAQNRHQGTCTGGGAPEVVYSLTLDRRQQVTVAVEQEYDGAVYIRRECEDQGSEVPGACNDDDQDTQHSWVSAALDPGTYFIFADGFGNNRGRYTLTVSAQDVPSPAEVCQNATPLTPNQPVTGQFGQDFNVFQARCAGGARGPDRVYRLEVPQESRLQLHQESAYDGVLYLRRACADPGSEMECNDDQEDVRHSRINTVVPAGTYYVFSDALTPRATGAYTLEADLAPLAGGNTPGDTCADAQPLPPNGAVDGNTLQARDDVATPCASAQDGYDVVYRLDVAARSRVRLWFDHADLGTSIALGLARNCNQLAQSLVACRAGAIREQQAIDEELQPGTYYVVVDSATPRGFGRFRLNSRVEDVTALERLCRSAPLLRPGRTVSGTTAGGTDRFQAGCAGGARSPETLYRLVLRRRAMVRLNLSTPSHDGAIYIRQNCTSQTSERACNDDNPDTRHSLIETTLDAGTYTVFIDGFSEGNSGAFTLDVQVTNQ